MKIGTLTYHAALNYGALLQCYALQRSLGQLGHDVHVINYVDQNQADNSSMYRHSKGLRRLAMNAVFAPFHVVRKRKLERFKAFRENELNLTRRVQDIDGLQSLIAEEGFDAVVVGSDQVWNPHIKDFTKAFFLPFAMRGKKLGYAISTGDSTAADLRDFTEHMRAFDAVSVREATSASMLARITESRAPVALDPVFFLDRADWSKLADCDVPNTPYLLCYFITKEKLGQCLKIAEGIARHLGLKLIRIHSSFTKESLRRGVIFDAGAREFLSLLSNATAVCTDSFHGTAFSVIFERDFLALECSNALDSRKKSLLDQLELGSRLVPLDSAASSDMLHTLDEHADFTAPKEKLRKLGEASSLFLVDSLAEVKA